MDNNTFILKNLELVEKNLRFSLRIVNNLQTLLNSDGTVTEEIFQEVNKLNKEIINNNNAIDLVVNETSEALDADEVYLHCQKIAKELVLKYFHESVIADGKGTISMEDAFKLYFGKLLELSVETVSGYPVGFYTDNSEHGLQFLFTMNESVIIIDQLDTEPVFYFIHVNDGEYSLEKFNKQIFDEHLELIEKTLSELK